MSIALRAQQNDVASSMQELRIKALNGNGQAAFFLAEIYADGKGIAKDPDEAKRWFEIAAELNYGPIDVANRYWVGRGVPQDVERAVYWYQRVGCHTAGYQLGKMYELGVGVPQDYTKAADCYRQMMDSNSHARLGIANLTAKGLGVPRDELTALTLFRESAEREIGGVAFEIAVRYSLGRGIPEDEAQASHWWRVSATYHNGGAATNLARNLLDGKGVSRAALAAYLWTSLDSDITYYAKSERDELASVLSAADVKQADTLIDSLRATRKNNGAFYDNLNPIVYMSETELQRAAAAHDVEALFSLAYRRENGQGMDKNVVAAMDAYRQVVFDAAPDLYAALGIGEEARGNLNVAMKWYLEAATAGSAQAQYRVGLAYQAGEVVQKDQVEACKWFILAADSDSAGLQRVDELKRTLDDKQFTSAQADAVAIRNSYAR
jgi:TPR repeat protein